MAGTGSGAAVARVVLRPGGSAVAAVAEAGRSLPGDVRVAVVSGAFDGSGPGPRRAASPSDLAWLRRRDLVSVAAVGGPATGEGLEVALACRFRVLAHAATLSLGEPQAGTLPGAGAVGRLGHLVGTDRAAELALTGRHVSATEAVQLGLATLAVPPADLGPTVDDLVAALLAVPRDVTAEVLLQVDDPTADPAEALARLRADPG